MNARVWMWISFLMAYVIGFAAFVFICLAAWTAWAGEPPLVIPTPVPAYSVANDVQSYAQGGAGLGLVALLWKLVGTFGSHFKTEEKLLGKIADFLEKHDKRLELEAAERRGAEKVARENTNPMSVVER